MFPSLCVFCGSSSGASPVYLDAARELGRTAAQRGIGIVYGGARVGLMGALADAALAHGGKVTGVIPQALVDREIAHTGLTELHVVESMHDRKALMSQLASAFIAMPGGFGTFEEFFEVLTWAQLGLHAKPCGLWNVNGYYEPLLRMADHAVAEGFLRPALRASMLSHQKIEELFKLLESHQAPQISKWM